MRTVSVSDDPSFRSYLLEQIPIQNWSIDSTEAVSIANENSEVKEFISEYQPKYENLEIDLILLGGTESPIWEIRYYVTDWHGDGTGTVISITKNINASTGEIVSVNQEDYDRPRWPFQERDSSTDWWVVLIVICLVLIITIAIWRMLKAVK